MLLALAPLAYLIHLCVRLHIDVPFGDQWELVPRLAHFQSGALSFNDVWRQHNEHRPAFPILIMLGLARATRWNISAEIAANVVLGAGIFLVCAAALRSVYRGLPEARWWLLPVLSLLIFSPQQWENWLWGWQIQIFLGVLAGLVGFWLLAHPKPSAWRFGGALLCGVVGTYSFSSGLTYWVVGPIALWLRPELRGWRRAGLWTVVGSATIASYFTDYHLNPGHPSLLSNFATLDAFGKFMLYVVKYLGAPVASVSVPLAALTGAAGLVLFFALLAARWRQRGTAGFVFPCTVGLNAVAAAVMTGLGRAGYGSDQALSSRYGTIAEPLWLAIAFLALCVALKGVPSAYTRRRAGMMAVGAVLVSLVVVSSGQAALVAAKARMNHLRPLRVALRGAWDWPKVAQLYVNNVPLTQERVQQLQAMQMSVFRTQ